MISKIVSTLIPSQGAALKDSLSGLTVALALVPEAIAFALVAGVSPAVGLYAAFFMCFITAVAGGRPGMISGATGSMAVVMVAIVSQHGLAMLFATILLTGLLQCLAGVFRMGKVIKMLPKPVMIGFVNGLAIVIFMAQFGQFKALNSLGELEYLQGAPLFLMVGLVALAMMITYLLPKLTKTIPSALAAIISVTFMTLAFKLPVRTVNDMMQGMSALPLPHFQLPMVPFNFETLRICFPFALILAVIGLAESLMTLSLIDERTQTKGNGNRECLAQGLGNIVSGCFGAMGGCAMIGQSMINITSGGRGRLSGIVAASALLCFMLFAWPLIKLIPLAALVGVMFMVVYETFDWSSLKIAHKIPRQDTFIIIIVTLITIFSDLAIAVLSGVVIASLVFAWQSAKNIYAESTRKDCGEKEYTVKGLLFFASTGQFKSLFDIENDPMQTVVDFKQAKICDQSAVEAISFIATKYHALGKTLHLRHLNQECHQLLRRATLMEDVKHLESRYQLCQN